MPARALLLLPVAVAFLVATLAALPAPACCPAPPGGKPVVNADQTVIILWDAATKTQHFIRRASFKSEADDFGFLVPSPTQPELSESGNDAFPYLQKLTEPEKEQRPRPSGGMGCGCGSKSTVKSVPPDAVRVLEQKVVAGFNAAVLEADSAAALVGWLKEHGYAFSPEIEAWARPYVEGRWKITALKVAKSPDGKQDKQVAASALRMTFKTDRPLFPYREPDYKSAVEALGATSRPLRIYFLAEGRYQGELPGDTPWTGRAAWAGKLGAADRKKVLELLKLPEGTGPAEWWLTEFEDHWQYKVAPGDVYFARDADQGEVRRPPIIEYVFSPWQVDVTVCAFALALVLPPLVRRIRRGRAA